MSPPFIPGVRWNIKRPSGATATVAFAWVVKGARRASQADSVATELCHLSIADV